MSTAPDLTDTCKIIEAVPGCRDYTKKSAQHFDTGKPQLQWIPFEPLAEVAKVFEFGAGKYGQHNYKGGMKWSKMVGSILRHTYRFMNGEDKDDESGLPHLAHAACCCLMLLYFYKHHPDLDDRVSGA